MRKNIRNSPNTLSLVLPTKSIWRCQNKNITWNKFVEIKKHCFQRLEFISSEFGRWFVSMQLQCFFVCLQALICAIASFWQDISWVFFCSFFCFQSGAISLPICCVLELKYAMCCLLGLKSLTRVVPQCFNGFHWFCHGLHVFNGFGWNLSGLH